MFSVLFIDDDDFMLRALLRLARRLRPNWEFYSCQDATVWSNAVAANVKIDLVVCDYLMPQIHGDKVLAEVALLQPEAIRTLLTGDTTENVICDSGKIAHFVLSKPFNEGDFLQLFTCVELVHALPVSANTRAMLGSSALLLPLPDIVRKLKTLLHDEHCNAMDIVELVQHEPLIVAKLIQLANSSYMGFSRATLSLEEAIKRLGIKLTDAVITSIAMEHASEAMLEHELHRKINDAAYNVANQSQQLCALLNCNQDVKDELFVAALLSVIGQLITSTQQWQQKFAADYTSWSELTLRSVVSAYMLTLWGYNEKLVQAVLLSSAPDFSYTDDNLPLLLYLARQRAENNGRLPQSTVSALPDELIRQKLSSC